MPSQLAQGLRCPERFLVLHYWNPAYLIPLVEIVPHAATRRGVFDTTKQLLSRCGKTPIVLRREVPGVIGNRLAFALQREAMALVEEGIASPEDIDDVVWAGFGRRVMASGGGHGGLGRFGCVTRHLPIVVFRSQCSARTAAEIDGISRRPATRSEDRRGVVSLRREDGTRVKGGRGGGVAALGQNGSGKIGKSRGS